MECGAHDRSGFRQQGLMVRSACRRILAYFAFSNVSEAELMQ